MKKIICSIAGLLTAFIAAQADTVFYFQTVGPDKYEDGTSVIDGEFYALVWTKAGTAFAGFNADATLKDPANSTLVAAVPFARGGRLSTTQHQATDAQALSFVGGTFHVILLDTRNADGTLANATADELVNGRRPFKVVNGYKDVAAMTYASVLASSSLNIAAPIRVDAASLLPADTPKPVITGMTVREGANGREMVIKVKGTASYLRYTAAVTDDLSAAPKAVEAATGANGASDTESEVEIVVPVTGDKGFFKVIRK